MSTMTLRGPFGRWLGAVGRRWVPLVLALAVGACARPKGVRLAVEPEPFVPNASGWRVEPNDRLVVQVWREPQFTTPPEGVPVQADGRAFLPGMGRVALAGLTIDSVRTMISSAYRNRLLDPQVDVQLLRPIPVFGGVRTPGTYPMPPWASVRELLARAGGSLALAEQPEVYLQRGTTQVMPLPLDVPLTLVDVSSGDALFVNDRNYLQRTVPLLNVIAFVATTVLGVASFFR